MKGGKKLLGVILLSCMMIFGVRGQEQPLRSFGEVFQQTRIYPEIFTGKHFSGGEFCDYDTATQKIVKRDKQVWIPVRLALGEGWELLVDPKKPNEVGLKNVKENRIIKIRIGEKAASVNGEPFVLVEPLEKIDGAVRMSGATYEQLTGEKVYAKDGLIIFSKEEIDWQLGDSQKILEQCKVKVTDERKINNENITLLLKYNDTMYYNQYVCDSKTQISNEELWMKKGNQKPSQVKLPGNVVIYGEMVDNHLYFTSTIQEETKLYSYSIQNGNIQLVANMTKDVSWNEADDSIQGVRWYNGKLYIRLHYFDWTMGGEELCVLEGGKLKRLASAKQFLEWEVVGDEVYYIDTLSIHGEAENNLRAYNLKTGDVRSLGDSQTMFTLNGDYSGDIFDNIDVEKMIIQNGKIYVRGYSATDDNRLASVYAVDCATGEQQKLTVPASSFTIIENTVYYQDETLGYLVRCDLDGSNKKTLLSQQIMKLIYKDGSIYYTFGDKGQKIYPGVYKYNIKLGTRVKVAEHTVSELISNESAIYYKGTGLDEGIYKMTDRGNVCLVKDTVTNIKDTGKVLLYMLKYESGIYVAK